MTTTSANGEPLTRLTVNLIAKAAEALDHAAALSRDSRTDTVNRAIQVYDFLLEKQAHGAVLLMRESESTEQEVIRFL